MATKAYILIEATVGKSRDVWKALKEGKGITESYLITGPYDLVALIDAKDSDEVTTLVTSHIHTIPGIARTVTCLTIKT